MKFMGQGILLTVVGMVTVFVALAALALLIRSIDALIARKEGRNAPEPPPARPARSRPVGEEDDLTLVIAAAVGAYLEAEAAEVFLVPVARPDRSRWVMDGRVAGLSRSEALSGGSRT